MGRPIGLGLAEGELEALMEGEGLLSRRIANIRIILWYMICYLIGSN